MHTYVYVNKECNANLGVSLQVRINVEPGDPVGQILAVFSLEWHTEDGGVPCVVDGFKLDVAFGGLGFWYEPC
jgi:hypothetical protein